MSLSAAEIVLAIGSLDTEGIKRLGSVSKMRKMCCSMSVDKNQIDAALDDKTDVKHALALLLTKALQSYKKPYLETKVMDVEVDTGRNDSQQIDIGDVKEQMRQEKLLREMKQLGESYSLTYVGFYDKQFLWHSNIAPNSPHEQVYWQTKGTMLG